MAIEIELVKKESHLKQNLFLIFSIIIFLISLGIYFYFNVVILAQKQVELNRLNNEYTILTGSDVKEKENELASAGRYIGDFKILFESNPRVFGFFTSFQNMTHPKVVYAGLNFDIPSRKITTTGSTAGFQNIMQQIAILKVDTNIETYQISNINLAENGSVTFNLDLVVKSEVLK